MQAKVLLELLGTGVMLVTKFFPLGHTRKLDVTVVLVFGMVEPPACTWSSQPQPSVSFWTLLEACHVVYFQVKVQFIERLASIRKYSKTGKRAFLKSRTEQLFINNLLINNCHCSFYAGKDKEGKDNSCEIRAECEVSELFLCTDTWYYLINEHSQRTTCLIMFAHYYFSHAHL